jgi:hypothetical protein
MSFGGSGVNFTLGTTQTYVAPTVVPFGVNQYAVFHTGIDGHIYYTIVFTPDPNGGTPWVGYWVSIPNQFTNLPVSVTQFNSQNGFLYVVYRGAGFNTEVYGTWLDQNGWHLAGNNGNIGGGLANSAPSITYNPVSNSLWVAAEGTDGMLWTTHQTAYTADWSFWSSQGVAITTAPSIVAASDGNMMISYVGTDGHPRYGLFTQNLIPQTSWTPDTTGFQTTNQVVLTAVGLFVYALLVGYDNIGYWKQVTNNA